MPRALNEKSTLEDIRQRFDADVERFSKLETGQQAMIDSPLVLDLVSQVTATAVPAGGVLLDLGCGAGNFTLKVLERTHPLHCTLVDLSQPMLDRACTRVESTGRAASCTTLQQDMRALDLPEASVDAVLAAAVLHHLRDDADWHAMFARLYRWLKPGGLLFVWDPTTFDEPAVNELMWGRYGDYLATLGGEAYRDKVLAYIDAEDSPRPLRYQLELARKVGFSSWEVLHRTSICAAWYAQR